MKRATNLGGEVADAAAKQTPPTTDAAPVSGRAFPITHRRSSDPAVGYDPADTKQALRVIADELRGSLRAGSEFSGTLAYGEDLEVGITIRVKHRVSVTQKSRHRARAMTIFAFERIHDHCPRWVKNRSAWSSSKEKQCSGRVSAAIVRRFLEWEAGPLQPGKNRLLVPGESFEFVCAHHADVNDPNVLAVVRLEQSHLRTIRAKRAQHDADTRARERAAERELEAELPTLSDVDLAVRLGKAVAAHEWGIEDACLREQRRRHNQTKSAGGISRR